MEPLRPTDAPGALVMPPTPELLPTGSWEKPFVAGRENDGEGIDVPYAAAGAYVTAEGEGEIQLERDNTPVTSIEVTNPGLYALAEHPGHEPHRIGIRPTPGMRIWSVSFAPGVEAAPSGAA
jgi:hypothetical protein